MAARRASASSSTKRVTSRGSRPTIATGATPDAARPLRAGGTNMNWSELLAIDVHCHAEHSCRQPPDPIQAEFEAAAAIYFKASAKKPTIAETIAWYRARRIGFVMFTVDSEAGSGIHRIANEEIAEAANANSDIML